MTLTIAEFRCACLKSCPKLLSLLNYDNFILFTAFVEREAVCYNRSAEAQQEWMIAILKKIDEIIENVYELRLRGYSNAGIRLRVLDLDTIYVAPPHKRMVIDFCTCGRLDHWGSVRTEDI